VPSKSGDNESGVFRGALRNQRDRTDDFFAHFGHDPVITDTLRKSDGQVKLKIREVMKRARPPQGLFSISEIAEPYRKEARAYLDDGLVAAVDGTNALEPSDMMTTGFYGCAVGYLTTKMRSTPVVRVTQTSTKYADHDFEKEVNAQDLFKLCKELDGIKEEQSWPTTFREYIEREVAIDCKAPIVLIDGPIFTQNLSTQEDGRNILDRLHQESNKGRRFIGVIKNIGSSKSTLTTWCGFSLHTGEGFVIQSVNTLLRERYETTSKVVSGWANSLPTEYVRVVFRPANKSFGMECRIQDLGLAMAIMLEDASPTLNHELPMLIETVDSQIRAGFDAKAANKIIIGKIQEGDFQMGVDITNERDFR
jgi:hypothetical protein